MKKNKSNSYQSLVMKIVCYLILVILIFFLSTSVLPKNQLIGMLCFLFFMWCFIRIFVSIGELRKVADNNAFEKRKNQRNLEGCFYSIEHIIEMIEKTNIMSLEVRAEGTLVRAGVTSMYDKRKGVFYNRRYYYDETRYTELDEFKNVLTQISENGELEVIAINRNLVVKKR